MNNPIKLRYEIACLFVSLLVVLNCEGQSNKKQANTVDQKSSKTNQQPVDCNRTVYVSPKYIKDLPPYICIPAGFVIDDFVRFSDLNGDGVNDFFGLKYNRKKEQQSDGEVTYWRFYTRSKSDSLFNLKFELTNIVPPYIKKTTADYLESHPDAEKIFEQFPDRLSNSHSFKVNLDTIRLSYKFTDTYGKTFVFVYSKNNWYLENVEYFIGELPMYWWDDSDFFHPLEDKLKIIESRKPTERVSIDKLDLIKAFKYRETEWLHLAEGHIDLIDKSKWSSIDEVVFGKCDGPQLPADWVY